MANIDLTAVPHIVSIDRRGCPRDPADYRRPLDAAEYQHHIGGIMDRVRQAPVRNGRRQVLLYIHGGMNRPQAALDRARNSYQRILTDPQEGYCPVFINWNSSLLSSWWEHLVVVREGRESRIWAPILCPLQLFSDAMSVLAKAAPAWSQMISSDWNGFPWGGDFPGKRNARKLYQALVARFRAPRPGAAVPPAIAVSQGEDTRALWRRVLNAGLCLLTYPFKAVTCPIVAGLATPAWENMVRRTRLLFRAAAEFDVRRVEPGAGIEEALDGTEPTGSLSLLMRELATLVQRAAAGQEPPYEITLIGHSMGTIIANEVIRRWEELPFRNLVYMGAACSMRDFELHVIPYLRSHAETRFFNLCLHETAEVIESQALLWGWEFVPRGSLLVWIDNMLESPKTTLDRTLGCWENILQATHIFPPQLRPRIHIKSFNLTGRRAAGFAGTPERHGEFDDGEYWREAYWTPADV